MDFRKNPVGNSKMKPFAIEDLEEEGLTYLKKTGALQKTPIERLACMNQPAIDIYKEHGIDLWKEPLEIAVCAQHNNGGFAVNHWGESNIPRAFVVGEMAGTHGIKRRIRCTNQVSVESRAACNAPRLPPITQVHRHRVIGMPRRNNHRRIHLAPIHG